ncbi:hypothetical protein DINM_001330 [Dirofilaria immitis]|nr:hypothetical protein [Dirofilaria immitis]
MKKDRVDNSSPIGQLMLWSARAAQYICIAKRSTLHLFFLSSHSSASLPFLYYFDIFILTITSTSAKGIVVDDGQWRVKEIDQLDRRIGGRAADIMVSQFSALPI